MGQTCGQYFISPLLDSIENKLKEVEGKTDNEKTSIVNKILDKDKDHLRLNPTEDFKKIFKGKN